MQTRLLATLAILAVSAPAVAQPRGDGSTNYFRTIDRQGPFGYVGVDLGIGDPVGDDVQGELIAFRFDLHGQVLLNPNIGVYGSVPLSVLTTTEDNVDDSSVTGLGNLDLGGFYFTPIGTAGTTTLVIRGGFTLPTADDDIDGFVANIVAGLLVRPNDLVLAAPDISFLRGSASILHDTGSVSLRFDGGFDLPLFATEGEIDERDPLLRLNIGGAFGPGPTKFVVELVNLIPTNNLDDDDDVFQQLSAGVTSQSGTLTLGISASVLLDSIIEDDESGTYFAVIGSLASQI